MSSQDVSAASGHFSVTRQPAEHIVEASVGVFTARAAFSHVPFWQSLAEMTTRIVVDPVPGNPLVTAANQVPALGFSLREGNRPSGKGSFFPGACASLRCLESCSRSSRLVLQGCSPLSSCSQFHTRRCRFYHTWVG
jgi:hypothetical protein